MTRDELKTALVKQFPEEMHDSNMYFDMAQAAAHECNDPKLANQLYLISKDEYTHAKFIHDFMIMNGMCIPDDLKCKWMTLEARAKKIYPDITTCMYDVSIW